MGTKHQSLFLVKSGSNGMRRQRPTFRTDEIIPQSGIYCVRHQKHRLPHEVTLLRDQQFPRCSKCQDAVSFELVRAVKAGNDFASGESVLIYLYELPVFEEFEENKPVAV